MLYQMHGAAGTTPPRFCGLPHLHREDVEADLRGFCDAGTSSFYCADARRCHRPSAPRQACGIGCRLASHYPKKPQGRRCICCLGSVLSQEGKYEDAVPAYRKALGLNPKLPGIQLNLGIAQFKLGHLAQAITPLPALAADPKSAQAQALLGLSFYGARLGRLYRATGNAAATQREFCDSSQLHKKAKDDVLEKMSGAPPPFAAMNYEA